MLTSGCLAFCATHVQAPEGGPNWAEIVTAVATSIVAAGIIVAGVQLRDGRRVRNAEVASALAQRWDCPDMVESRKRILAITAERPASEAIAALTEAVRAAKATQGNNDYYLFTRYLNFFEEAGVTCRHRSSGLVIVETLLGTTIRDNWSIWREVIRQVWGEQSKAAENFGALAVKLDQRHQRRMRRWWRTRSGG